MRNRTYYVGLGMSYTQLAILKFVRGYLLSTDHRMGPTYKEIADYIGFTAMGVYYQVQKLEKMGYIQQRPCTQIRCQRNIRRVRLPGEKELDE